MNNLYVQYILLSLYTLFILHIFFNKILANYKKKTGTLNLKECISLLNDLIIMQLSLYNENVFDNINSLTKQEFQTYTVRICKDIAESISDELMINLTRLMSEDAVYIYISKKVKGYLIEKGKE